MSLKIKISILVFLLLTLLNNNFIERVYSQTETLTPTITPTPIQNTQAINDLQNKINELQGKISNLQNQEKTLSSQISVMDSQIKLIEYRIQATKEQIISIALDIDTTSKKINNLQNALNDSITVLLNRIVATYQVGSIQPLQILLTSGNAQDFLQRLNYLRRAQIHDKQLIYDTQQAKVDYANQKSIFEDKKKQAELLQKQLLTYTEELDKEKDAKKQLLAETQGSESNYQKLLSDTKAQLASFSSFVTSQGGASILGNQTSCDGWGCYYNQRDGQWGNNALNGTGYSLASDGCLVASMAMVYTHYGYKDITPQTINSVSSNFAGIPPALLKKQIIANGTSSSRVYANIDSTLATGDPVIIGISYDSGNWPDHFLVLISGSNGNYMMNDPFTPNGKNISFRDRYPTVKIVEIEKVVF